MKAPPAEVPYVKAPLLQRVRMSITLAVIRFGFALVSIFYRWRSLRMPIDKRPTIIKSYPPLPSHEARIFIPSTYKASDPPLHLLIDIHGGGYCFGAPWTDDVDNAILCHTHGFCVVSIDYRTGPVHKFPTAPKDCAAIISAVLSDESLPVDRSKVVLVGYSAGGNLVLTAPQILPESDRAKVKGVVAYYPSVNSVPNTKEKIDRQILPPGVRDILHGLNPSFGYGYISVGQNRADPLISPIFADRETLPPNICLVGCEYDILCNEASDMAEDLAEQEGKKKVPLADGRNGWTAGRVRWELIEGAVHGFNQRLQNDPKSVAKTLKMHQGAVEWINKMVIN